MTESSRQRDSLLLELTLHAQIALWIPSAHTMHKTVFLAPQMEPQMVNLASSMSHRACAQWERQEEFILTSHNAWFVVLTLTKTRPDLMIASPAQQTLTPTFWTKEPPLLIAPAPADTPEQSLMLALLVQAIPTSPLAVPLPAQHALNTPLLMARLLASTSQIVCVLRASSETLLMEMLNAQSALWTLTKTAKEQPLARNVLRTLRLKMQQLETQYLLARATKDTPKLMIPTAYHLLARQTNAT